MRGSILPTLSLMSLALAACGGSPGCDEALGGLCVGAPEVVAVGDAITDAVVVDLAGDGREALVTISRDAAALRIVDPGGVTRTLPLAGEPSALVAGELTGDGIVDVAVALRTADAVAIFAGDGAGGLTLRSTHAVGRAPRDLWIGDLDGDGRPELASADAGDGRLSILDGRDRRRLVVTAGEAPIELAAGDLDGDGHLDLIALDFAGGAILGLRGGGDGRLQTPTILAEEPAAAAIAVADVDGDGSADLVAQAEDGSITLRPGDGSGGLGPPRAIPTPGAAAPGLVALAAEGETPGAIVAAVGSEVFTWPIDQARSIGAPHRRARGFVTGGLRPLGPRAVAFTDPSWVLADDIDHELRLAPTWDLPSPEAPHVYVSGEPAFGDLDGDGDLDLAVNTWRDGILTYHGDGRGGFERRAIVPAPAGYVLAIVDLGGDGRPELAVADKDTLWVAVQGADGSFTPAPTIALRGEVEAMVALRGGDRGRIAVDLGPAGLDLLSVDPGDGSLSAITPRPGLLAARLRAGDLDGDGDDDLAILGILGEDHGLTSILSEGIGTMDGPLHPLQGLLGGDAIARDLAVGDLDGDEIADAVVAADDRVVRVLDLASAAPALAIDPVEYEPSLEWGPLSLGDLDGDGALDLLRPHLGVLVTHRGDRGAGFDPTPELRAFAAEPRILPADLRRDARVDFVTKDERELRAFVGELAPVARPRAKWWVRADFQRIFGADLDGDGAREIALVDARGFALVRDPGGPDEAMLAHLADDAILGGTTTGLAGDAAVRGGAIADLDGDGASELLLAVTPPASTACGVQAIWTHRGEPVIDLLEIDGDLECGDLADLLAADLDGDDAVDLVLLRREGRSVIAFGDGRGRFSAPVAAPELPAGRAQLADLDGDGRGDLVIDHGDAHTIVWQLADRRWQIGVVARGPAILRPEGDLVVAAAGQLLQTPLRGREVGSSLVLAEDPALDDATRIIAGDLDGDGTSDLVTLHESAAILWLDRHGALIRGARRALGPIRDLAIFARDRGHPGDLFGLRPGPGGGAHLWRILGEPR